MKPLKTTALFIALLTLSMGVNASPSEDALKKRFEALEKRYIALNKAHNQLKFKHDKQAACNDKKPKLAKDVLW